MRITQQLLRSKASSPLQSLEYLDLSNLGITHIERLNCCPKLQALNVRGNSIVEVSNLEHNRHLWRLDLSNNEIKDLDSLTKFVALGTLNLANNDLSWHDIGKLRHLHVLELSIHGNKNLERDPYYRIHLIDCLPHVWMLDGRIITSAERLQVKHFFADSAMTDHPIRRKLSKEWFVPSALKKIEVNGVYGEKATHLMIRFPANGVSNIEMDRRRLKYLAHNAQEDLILQKKYTKRDYQVLKYRKTFIEDILEVRPGDRERCNMLLLLLVATLEFVMPTHLVKETLETAKLSRIGKLYTMDLFLLPKDIRCRLVCILLGAVKVDKDNKEDGGLYDRLYLCLFYTVAELSKLSNSIFGRNTAPKTNMTQLYRDYKCLLASEIVQLLCIVPAFFEYVDKDVGVVNLVVTATGDVMITEKISKLSENILNAGGDIKALYEELSDFLLQKVQDQSTNLTNKSQKLPQGDQVMTAMKSIPMKSPRSPLDAADFHAKGITSPNLDPPSILSAKSLAVKSRKHFPHLGDYLLLGPQTLGKIIGLPQPFVAHVAMDSIPVSNGAMESKLKQSEDHYTYVNMDQLAWDPQLSFWKPRGSIGDRFTIHTIEDLRKELNRRSNLPGEHIPRPNSPEETTRAFSMTPRQDSATSPLIYTPGGYQYMSEEYLSSRKPPYQQNEFVPRPMTSLLKEKLDLKLDFSSRRTQSAGAVERTSRQSQFSPTSPRNSLENKSMKSADSKSVLGHDEGARVLGHDEGARVLGHDEGARVLGHDEGARVLGHDEGARVLGHDEGARVLGHDDGTNVLGHDGGSVGAPSTECVHCAIAAALAKDTDQSADVKIPDHVHEYSSQQTESDKNPRDTTQPDLQSAKESNKENDQPETSRTDMESLAHSDEEPELQNLITSRSEKPATAPDSQGAETQKLGTNLQPNGHKSGTLFNSLQINIPQVELMESADNQDGKDTRKGKVPVIMGRQSQMSSRASIKTGNLSVQGPGKNRPFSALDAYRYILDHPRKPENIYNTSYQQQRTEAWRQSATTTTTTTSASTPHTHFEVVNGFGIPPNGLDGLKITPPTEDNASWEAESVFSDNQSDSVVEAQEIIALSDFYSRQGTPPPQRPSSPESKNRPGSSFSVKKANDWLAGGRDLYWESIQKRPRSGHVPGWKDGLPDSMKRPRSAVATRTLNRQSRRTAPVTPSSLAYEAMMQAGGHGISPRGSYGSQIPDMIDLSEYQPLYHHLGLPRRLGSAGSGGSHDYSTQQTQDTVYRMPPSSPTRQKSPVCQNPGSGLHTPTYMHNIYDAIDEETYTHVSDPIEIGNQKSANIIEAK